MLSRNALRHFRATLTRMADEAVVRRKLTEALKPTYLEVTDFSDGCGAKFNILAVSDAFQGKQLLACHRLINDALKEDMATIHALQMKTYTPEKWEVVQKKEKEEQAKMQGCIK